jgi:hypothetical protein
LKGFIDAEQMERLIGVYAKSRYGDYLRQVMDENPMRARSGL